MGLVKVTYVDGTTVITAENLNDIQDSVIDLESEVGDLTDLDTTDKTDIVSAINEVVGEIGDIETLLSAI